MGSASEDWARLKRSRGKMSFGDIISRDVRIRRAQGEVDRRQNTEKPSGYRMICDECHARYAIGGSRGIFLCPDCYRERFAREYAGDRDSWAGEARGEWN